MPARHPTGDPHRGSGGACCGDLCRSDGPHRNLRPPDQAGARVSPSGVSLNGWRASALRTAPRNRWSSPSRGR